MSCGDDAFNLQAAHDVALAFAAKNRASLTEDIVGQIHTAASSPTAATGGCPATASTTATAGCATAALTASPTTAAGCATAALTASPTAALL